MKRSARRHTSAGLWVLMFLLAAPHSVYADNCSALSDCYGQVAAAAAVVAALALLVLLGVVIFGLFELAAVGEVVGAAAAEGLAEGAAEAVAEMAAEAAGEGMAEAAAMEAAAAEAAAAEAAAAMEAAAAEAAAAPEVAEGLEAAESMAERFANLSNKEINQQIIGDQQRELLKELLGTDIKGAANSLENFKVPEGITRQTLEAYREIARRVLAEGSAKASEKAVILQRMRINIIQQALDSLGPG